MTEQKYNLSPTTAEEFCNLVIEESERKQRASSTLQLLKKSESDLGLAFTSPQRIHYHRVNPNPTKVNIFGPEYH